MTDEELMERYQRARNNAVREIEDLTPGSDPSRVYAAMECALLWKIALSIPVAKFKLPVLDEMLDATNE